MQLEASPFIVMILDCEQIGNFIVMNLLPLLVLTVCNYVIYKTVSRWGAMGPGCGCLYLNRI